MSIPSSSQSDSSLPDNANNDSITDVITNNFVTFCRHDKNSKSVIDDTICCAFENDNHD